MHHAAGDALDILVPTVGRAEHHPVADFRRSGMVVNPISIGPLAPHVRTIVFECSWANLQNESAFGLIPVFLDGLVGEEDAALGAVRLDVQRDDDEVAKN